MGDRTYPRAYDLTKVKNWLSILDQYAVPLIEISRRKLNEREEASVLNPEVLNQVRQWKNEKGIDFSDDLEYKYFLQHLSCITHRTLDTKMDLYVPLAGDGPQLSEVIPDSSGREHMYYLTPEGRKLARYDQSGENLKYEGMLLWLLIRCTEFRPILQRAVTNPNVYDSKQFEDAPLSRDSTSRECVKNWARYFSLVQEDGMLGRQRMGHLIAMAITFELNRRLEDDGATELIIQDWLEKVREQFQLDGSFFDLAQALEIAYEANSGRIDGFTAGRRMKSLPHHSDCQVLSINSELTIPISSISSSRLQAIIPLDNR
jgi:hypothetical protein